MLDVFLLTYGLVLVAEIAGDKLLYTTGTLATRYRPAAILTGVTLAFMLKMLVAVLFGVTVAGLRPRTIAAISTVTFLVMAFALWLEPKKTAQSQGKTSASSARAAAVSFAAVFFSEWADIGQVTAATLAAEYRVPLLVWMGATLAMVTKAALVIFTGGTLRRYVPQSVLRYCGASLLLAMGVLSALGLAR